MVKFCWGTEIQRFTKTTKTTTTTTTDLENDEEGLQYTANGQSDNYGFEHHVKRFDQLSPE